MSLVTVIMAHPARAEMVTELRARLDTDPIIITDTAGEGIWPTARRALVTGADTGASHVLLLQDDALVSRGLVAAVERLLAVRGDGRPISLYLGRKRPNEARFTSIIAAANESGAVLIEMTGPWWGVGCVYPVSHLTPMIAWCDAYSNPSPPGTYDGRVTAYYRHRGTWLYPWPSLVDHRDGPSLHARRTAEGRRAFSFIGTDRSGTEIDWTGHVQGSDPVSLHPPVRFVNPTSGQIRIVGKRTRQYDRLVRDGRYRLVGEPLA